MEQRKNLPFGLEPYTDIISGSIPLSPTTNHSYDIRSITTKTGKRAHTLRATNEYAAFKEMAASTLARGCGIQKAQGIIDIVRKINSRDKLIHALINENEVNVIELCCTLTFWSADKFSYDIDGRVKGTIDAICKDIHINDKFITSLTVSKRVDPYISYCIFSLYIRPVYEDPIPVNPIETLFQ